MHIQKIKVKDFMHFKEAEISLPSTGITLVTGPNGSGKSGLFIEGPATALFGKTLRKTPPWKKDVAGSVEVLTDELIACRAKTPSSSPTLKWSTTKKISDHTTTTKSKKELENITGDWDTWRRTRILSTQEQEETYFTLASDGERKRLIEGLIGLDIFDPALESCRKDKREVENKLTKYKKDYAVLNERVRILKDNLKDATENLGEEPEDNIEELKNKYKKLKVRYEKIEKHIKNCKSESQEYREQYYKLNKEETEANLKVKEAKRKADALDYDKCPTCGKDIEQELKDSLKGNITKAKSVADKLKITNEKKVLEVTNLIKELDEEKDLLINRQLKITKEREALKKEAEARKKVLEDYISKKNSVGKIRADLKESKRLRDEKKSQIEENTNELDEILASEIVLGLEGVRAQIIGKALGGIETVANKWLNQIADPDAKIELKPYSETKTAGVKDKIALIIHGMGGGYGYKGASAGERRRIDVSFLFSLSEIAAAARGIEGGDIFVDEVADSLDEIGKNNVAEILKEIAEEESVIVITHDEKFGKMLNPVKHFSISKKNKVSYINDNT